MWGKMAIPRYSSPTPTPTPSPSPSAIEMGNTAEELEI
jgi:hypothetical protein